MSKITARTRTLAALLLAGLSLAACSQTYATHGDPPLSAVPDKLRTFTKPYFAHFSTGFYGAATLLAINTMPGRCEGLYMQGDRALLCDQLARWNGLEEPKPDPNARYRCIRTLGGGTECVEVRPPPAPETSADPTAR
jgi:hypothetical protein